MTTKKKSYAARLGAVTLALTLITTCLLGGTMAKYVTEVTGTATATVAAWSFKANNNDTMFSTIDLGDTEHRTNYEKTDIKAGVIAPGTEGSFDIVIDGSGSEVGVDYAMKIAEADGITLPDDLTFKVGSDSYTLGQEIKGTIDYSATENAMKKTLTVTWEWPFDTNDDKNTNDNEFKGKSWTLDITVTGEQTTLAEPTS